MKRTRRVLVGSALLLGGPLVCVVTWLLIYYPGAQWWITARPPIPDRVLQIRTDYPRDYVTDGVYRSTSFSLNQTPEEIRQFYRTELSRRGWLYQGAVRPECGSTLLDSSALIDVYDRGRILHVRIKTSTDGSVRHVSLDEWPHRAYALEATATAVEPRAALIGDWTSADTPPGGVFVVCFYEEGKVLFMGPGATAMLAGVYQWIRDDVIRITHSSSRTFFSTDLRRPGDINLCSEIPDIFADACHSDIADPADYPAPAVPLAPTPTFDPTDPSTYPAPVQEETVTRRIEIEFSVALDDGTLTLTGPDGTDQTFRRIVR